MVLAVAFAVAAPVLAVDVWGGQESAVETELDLGAAADPRVVASRIINLMLGFLGLIAVVLILFAGFKWMTAAGNEDKIAESKKLMAAGVIGLIIILASWGLAQYVLSNLMTAIAP